MNFYDNSPKYRTHTDLLTSLLPSTDPVSHLLVLLKFTATSDPHVQQFSSHFASDLYLHSEDWEPKPVFWFLVSCGVLGFFLFHKTLQVFHCSRSFGISTFLIHYLPVLASLQTGKNGIWIFIENINLQRIQSLVALKTCFTFEYIHYSAQWIFNEFVLSSYTHHLKNSNSLLKFRYTRVPDSLDLLAQLPLSKKEMLKN